MKMGIKGLFLLAALTLTLTVTAADSDTLYFQPMSESDPCECPSSSTCCQSTSGEWACCPFPQDSVQSLSTTDQAFVELSDVICPDSRYHCPDKTTCCKTNTGYGCCPYPEAVCCKDNTTCCPSGYTCNEQKMTCDKDAISISRANKFDAHIQPQVQMDGMCPDHKGSCPSSATCCKLKSGDYGCCPLPKATCCNDNEHCCPEGYTCDVQGGRCLSGAWEAIEWVTKMPTDPVMVTPVEKGINKACPGGEVSCPNTSTCCQLASGAYGCCPFKDASCCSDHLHCCPEGYTCDVKHQTCKSGDGLATPWNTKVTAQAMGIKDPTCPDLTACPQGTTCCQIDDNGKYGCCPIPDGVCCPDHRHCCPKGMSCNTDHGTCEWNGHTKTWTSLPAYEPTPAGRAPSRSEDITCPDKQSTCPSGSTCCEMQSGWYGCCPNTNAVCCADHLHCCTSGQTCDTEKGLCKDGDVGTPWKEKQMATRIPHTGSVQCNETAFCPDATTCCKQGKSFACCPLPEAMCCPDQVHCCPNGYKCDSTLKTCTKGMETVPMTSKIPVEPTPPTPVYLVEGKPPTSVKCDDGSECPDSNTCCDMGRGHFGCCPMPDAVCCSDQIHCCPSGYQCDTSAGTCNRGTESVAMITKLGMRSDWSGSPVICADKSVCPDGTTCCQMASGKWGCCPYPKAVCCGDKVHCCPAGYKCGSGSCAKGDAAAVETVPWSKKIPAVIHNDPIDVGEVCPEQQVQCPSGSTCCKISTGGYGCCPFEKAVCCEDKLHCCPNGYKCDTAVGTCTKSSDYTHSIPWSKKVPALSHTKNTDDNEMCPDKQTQCPSGSTCCELAAGGYGCCPYEKAVCCSDHLHCCPADMKCDVAQSKCQSTVNGLAISWNELKEPELMRVKEDMTAVKCKDGQECPWGQTCCELSTGKYGCCPLPNATCCPDKVHCCPAGTTCDAPHSRCTSNTNSLTVSWDSVFTATPASADEVQTVKCDDGSECPDGSTCCDMGGGKFGCCPLPKAVCCEDHEHCCPSGMTCDVAQGRCSDSLAYITSIPAHTMEAAKALGAVICPDHQHECPDHSTCCLMADKSWGCCPMPRAVCCTDGEHCCPAGYKCDTRGGICQRELTPYNTRMLEPVHPAHLHQQPDQ